MSFNLSSVKHLSPQTLKTWIVNSQTSLGDKFLVIDVRDSDHIGGNIVNSLHIPSDSFNDTMAMKSLFKTISDNNINNVVFHCMLSQQRGPRAALKFGRFLESENASSIINIYVLDGGFNYWQRLYKNDPSLMENYHSDLW